MKLIISTLIAAAAFTSLHANERDDYYNSLLAAHTPTPRRSFIAMPLAIIAIAITT